MSISFFWSRAFLTKRSFLWLLLICNLIGTVYGYYWYGGQLEYTLDNYAPWLLVFVPDSPTASLFFTIAIGFLLFPPSGRLGSGFRQIIEALAVVTSVKYGIWASAIIFAGAAQGEPLIWQDWMLVCSHTIMAVEALVYVRFFLMKPWALLVGAAWTFLNDTIDYTYGVFPFLPQPLYDHVTWIRNGTIMLTLFSVLAGWAAVFQARRSSNRGSLDHEF
ncbi:DUF1405 domain-containing protein [Paenibacillus sp. JX-17]|uniref:DUF1405 domain-containing protein n=1 Tax=Paenibacillus lacisoli TaxID=3064525 RepID=A0ABT9C715_9BACL|nr:DUF1405 domain-containing protein [Paenibacillus sp. JX-17]MDO7905046.1 DUF1405 domain-containing protein [Paenibacillus sp. JX-17]